MTDLVRNVNPTEGPVNNVETPSHFFRGELKERSFSLRRISAGGIPKPFVNGSFTEDGNGTIIDVEITMKSNTYRKMGYGYLVILIGLIYALMDGGYEWYQMILPASILVIGYTTIIVTYSKERKKAEDKLMSIFDDSTIPYNS